MTKPTKITKVTKSDEDIEIESRTLAEQIARMTNEKETRGGFTWEDACATLNGLIESAREITGINPGHTEVYCVECGEDIENCDCEREGAGECLTCGTQCDDEGICPNCASVEWAQEERRTAQGAEAIAAAEREMAAVLSRPLDSCRKCGQSIQLRDIVQGTACTDAGEGEEAGRVFVYCSHTCRETH